MTEAAPARVDHFQDLATQKHASELGMWVFLGSETLLFAGLFAAYTAMRVAHGRNFVEAARRNDLVLGSVMTITLIVSSFLVAWAVHLLRGAEAKHSVAALAGAVAMGTAFIGMKAYEYAHHIADRITPGVSYAFEDLPSDGARMFFTLYYALTGLHALHVLVGLAALTWAAVQIMRGKLSERWHHPLDLVGLYWHLVDMMWIFLWPMLYQGV